MTIYYVKGIFMQSQIQKQRSPALDIVRCFALLCVVSVHFFLNSSFYSTALVGEKMYLMTLVRTGAMICVPLFIMLTGYLMCHKKPEPRYFSKLGRTLGTYLLAGIACTLYLILFWKNSYTLSGLIKSVLNYSIAPYGWYIEMYIGLFLLAPFLNLCYQNIESRGTKKILLGILILLTSLPSIVNIYQFSSIAWWNNPTISADYTKILPSWWLGIYPITYYFLGCYLREYPLAIKRSTNLLLIACLWVAAGSFVFYRSHGVPFINGAWTEYYSFMTLVQSALVFNFLARGNYHRIGKVTAYILKRLSEWTLGAYLLSYIFDMHFYTILRANVPDATDQFLYFPLIVACVYTLSLLASGVLHAIQQFLWNCLRMLWKALMHQRT